MRRSEVIRSREAATLDGDSDQSGSDGLDYYERNRAAWEKWAPTYAADARAAWDEDELRWGIWGTRESDLGLLNGLRAGSDIVELGSGAAALPAGLVRSGHRPVGVDFVRTLLEKGAELQREFGIWFPLLRANAERLHYDVASFDCVVSEYGASLWCDPYRWIPEAHRLLRPRGRLIFITNSALLMACTPELGGPVGDRLVRDYFASGHVEFPGDEAVEFHLTHGEWVRLLHGTGFTVENLVEIQPPPGATPRFDFATVEWAQRWPSEEIWVARKVS